MRNETKEALYSILDIMDAVASIGFMQTDIEKINRIRKEVLDIINEKSDIDRLDNNSEELLGVLPLILLDNKRFPAAKDILYFAERCLNIEVKNYWYKRSKPEVVGIVISEVSKQTPDQLNKFLKAWKNFNNNDESKLDINIRRNEQGFMETWFKFFDNYKGNK